jgi:DNA polymerase-3 subunit epsilon
MSSIPDLFNRINVFVKKKAEADDRACTWSGRISKDLPLKACPFVVFDTELSGLDRRRDFVLSVGAVRMTGGTVHLGKEFYKMVRPQGELTKKSVEIHGMTPDELKGQEEMDEVLPEFLRFISDAVLVGHFVNIDLEFLNKELKKRYRSRLENPAVDTHTIHEWLLENSREFKKHYRGGSDKSDLFSVAKRYGIAIDATHHALHDAFITAQLFQRCIYFLEESGIRSLSDLLDIGRA